LSGELSSTAHPTPPTASRRVVLIADRSAYIACPVYYDQPVRAREISRDIARDRLDASTREAPPVSAIIRDHTRAHLGYAMRPLAGGVPRGVSSDPNSGGQQERRV